MKVSNPLTIIAIFAGIAETSATVALVQLPYQIQVIFIFFVMCFPVLLVVLFFYVLYVKNTVFYAPSDYANQDHYLQVNEFKEILVEKTSEIFVDFNKNGNRLSNEEIQSAQETIKTTIEEFSQLPRKEQILAFLKSGPKTAIEMCESLGIHRSYIPRLLFALQAEGLIVRANPSSSKIPVWQLNT